MKYLTNIKQWPFVQHKNNNINHYVKNISGTISGVYNNNDKISVFINTSSTCWITSFSSLNLLLKNSFKNLASVGLLRRCKNSLFLLARNYFEKLAGIEDCVQVNNKMFSTSLWPKQLNDVVAIINEIQSKHAKRPIMFRSLNYQHNKTILDALTSVQCQLMISRKVAHFNPKANHKPKERANLKKDKQLLVDSDYTLCSTKDLTNSEIARIHELYTMLYIEKYNKDNPQYTTDFFKKVLEDDAFEILYLKKNTIDAFVIIEHLDGVIQSPCIGYDLTLPPQLGLYRQICSTIFSYSIDNNLLCNFSSGVFDFKKKRGCRSTPEYHVFYYQHLSCVKRMLIRCYLSISNYTTKAYYDCHKK